MSRFSRIIKNLKYMSKFNLRQFHSFELDLEDSITSTLYYIPNASIVRPNVIDDSKTIETLYKTKKSMARFGDGEIAIINGSDIPFQQYDAKLASRMREILQNTNDKLLVGINYWYFYPSYNPNETELDKRWLLFEMPKCRKKLIPLLNFETEYIDAGFTGIRTQQNKQNDMFYKQIRKIWEKHDVVCVGCREAHQKYEYDIFDNAKSETWIYVPNKNAFSEYDSILDKIKQYSKKSIVILMAGPTSKVLADDLSKSGYRALDLGHIAKSYDFYRKQIIINNDTAKDFWRPDL